MAKTLTEMAAEIVQAQASHANMSNEDVAEALKSTFMALSDIKNKEDSQSEMPVEEDQGAQVSDQLQKMRANPSRSIKRAKVVCLECGAEFKQLTNGHLKEHGLSTKEYRKKWGFTARQPLSSQQLSAKRRKSAEERGLGEKLKLARQKKAAKKGTKKSGK